MKTKSEPSSINTNTNVNNNTVHVHVPYSKKSLTKKKKTTHWLVKAIALAIIGIGVTLIVFYVENAGNHGEPTHTDKPVILPDK